MSDKKQLILILFLFFSVVGIAQELNCNISVVNTSESQNIDPQVFKTLEASLKEFMNNQKWSDDKFKMSEKIECNILINITEEVGDKNFKASATVQSNRPVYKSNYNSVLLNFIDKDFSFTYEEHQPLLFNQNAFLNNLTSLLGFYAYIIIGFDYDSFGLKAGDPHFIKAQEVLNNAQTTGYPGWKTDASSPNKRNRNMLIDNLFNIEFEAFRECLYKYHRKGLDKAHDDIKLSQNEVIASLTLLKKVNKSRPNSMLLTQFFNAKSDEIINLLKKAEPESITDLMGFLSRADSKNANRYRSLSSN